MDRFVGLDVLVRETGLCVVDANGTRLKEARVPTEPEAIAAVLEGGGFTLVAQASRPGRCRSGSRPELAARGLPVICAQAHHMRAALAAQREPRPIAHCARGIAQMMRGVPRPGFETALCAGHAAGLIPVAASASRPICSARV